MKKLLLLTSLALAACITYVQLHQTDADAGLNELFSHYKCYQARHAKRAPRFQAETVFLTDQFRDNVETSVTKLSTFCSRATQEPVGTGSAAGYANDLTCYTIRDKPRQERFAPQNVLVSDKLAGEQVLTVSKAQSLCVPSVKQPIDIDLLDRQAFVCYQAKTAKGQPRFQQADRRIDDQFDGKNVRVLRPVAFCTQTEKKVEAPNDDIEDDYFVAKLLLKGGEPVDLHVSTVHATLQPSDPPVSCKTDYTNSVWYSWEVSGENKSLIFDTSGSSYDTVLAAFEDNDPSDGVDLKEVGCNDDVNQCDPFLNGQAAGDCACRVGSPAGGDAGSCNPPTSSRLQFEAWANTRYYILAGSSDGHGGKLKLHITAKAADNGADLCSDPRSVGALDYDGFTWRDHVSTMNASLQIDGAAAGGACNPIDDPNLSCTGPYGASFWYTYTPPSHQKVEFDASDSSYPTVIAVYETNSSLEVACDDGSVNVRLEEGHKYLILVGSTDADNYNRGGKLKLAVTLVHKLGSDGVQSAGVHTAAVPYDSMTCYQVRQARHRPETKYALDQFSARQLPFTKGPGFWTLSVGGVDSICIPSTKSPCSAAVYSNHFQGNVGSEWSDTSTDTTPVGNRRFLGQFGDQTVSLNLDGLPEHDEVTVCFDLFAIDSLDGNDVSYGPDVWDLSVNGGPTLLHTTFSNEVVTPRPQNYPDSFPGSKSPPKTGAAEVDTLGYSSDFGDSVYHLVFTFAHAAGSIQFDFSALGLQGIGDESWGLDNVVVAVH